MKKHEELFTLLSILMAYVLFRLAWSHGGALIGAAALGISFHPLKRWMWRRLPHRGPSFHAGITSLIVVLFFVVPLVGMAWAAVAQAGGLLPVARDWRETVAQWRAGSIVDSNPAMKAFGGWAQSTFKVSPAELRSEIGGVIEKIIDSMAGAAAGFPAALASSILEVGLMVVALFFVFRDGEGFYDRFQEYLPLNSSQKAATRERVPDMVTAVIRGWLLCSVVQGVLATVAYGLAGVKGWILFGFLTMLAGLLPFIGTALVWVPLSVLKVAEGNVGWGIFLAAWGFFVVSLTDNFLRPYLMGRRSHIPFIFLFFALLGGINLWGIKGILLGPVLLALAPVIFQGKATDRG